MKQFPYFVKCHNVQIFNFPCHKNETDGKHILLAGNKDCKELIELVWDSPISSIKMSEDQAASEVFTYPWKNCWPLPILKDLYLYFPYLHIPPLQIYTCIFCTCIFHLPVLVFSVALIITILCSFWLDTKDLERLFISQERLWLLWS